ncbi:MAG: N(6)-L-threonylcarbamoyladenine synthase Kae1 [Candidatus Aenigmarchaeota archaeon]|nr:N(6)-L-threonylcarbamoyladenine synthase Kae1 [Candidatus Aenigmarchaeota archaeon]
MLILGIESTAHTLGIGIVEKDSGMQILANAKDVYKPKHGWGIHPSEAADHHRIVAKEVLEKALSESDVSFDNIDAIAYSAGPGLPPCLKAGLEFAQQLSNKYGKLLLPVNHCIGHIEIGKLLSGARDPVTLYVSGGNTQVIAYAAKRYRVFGETQDISIGNAIDTFIRETQGDYPGGPVMENLAKQGKNYIELSYVVKGMDLSFSGIMTSALQKFKKGASLDDLCFSFQETCYAMLTEVTERALAHTGKEEVLLTGGVAASQRLNEMLEMMCNERGAKFYRCPKEFSGDNGAMIAVAGMLAFASNQEGIKAEEADFKQRWRTDEADVAWLN